MLLLLFPGVTGQSDYRREIIGYVNNHRPIPPLTSHTPPRKTSATEQQLISVAQRLSLSKQNPIINHDIPEANNSRKQ